MNLADAITARPEQQADAAMDPEQRTKECLLRHINAQMGNMKQIHAAVLSGKLVEAERWMHEAKKTRQYIRAGLDRLRTQPWLADGRRVKA